MGKTMSVTVKCSDQFYADFYDSEGKILKEYEGYVPDFMPDEHYGDYVILDIDLETGQILNWRKNIKKEIDKFIKNAE